MSNYYVIFDGIKSPQFAFHSFASIFLFHSFQYFCIFLNWIIFIIRKDAFQFFVINSSRPVLNKSNSIKKKNYEYRSLWNIFLAERINKLSFKYAKIFLVVFTQLTEHHKKEQYKKEVEIKWKANRYFKDSYYDKFPMKHKGRRAFFFPSIYIKQEICFILSFFFFA